MDEFLESVGLKWIAPTDDKTIKETYWRIWRQDAFKAMEREKLEIILNNEGKIKVYNKEIFARNFECEEEILNLPLEIIDALNVDVYLKREERRFSKNKVEISFDQKGVLDYVDLFANEDEFEKFYPQFRLQVCFDEEAAYEGARKVMFDKVMNLGKRMEKEKENWAAEFIQGLYEDIQLTTKNGGI